jgi:adenylate cyclase
VSKPVILCVDDEDMILLSLRDQLRNHFSDTYRIEIIESGDEALEIARVLLRDHVDIPVIVCDQIMPGMKGNELLRHIHALSPKSFNILLTGQADASAVGDAVNYANLYRYIAKPWEETDLVLTIKEAIRSYYQDKKLEEQNETLREMNENLERLVKDRTREVVRQRDEIHRQMSSIETQRKDLEVRNDFIRRIFGRYVSDEVMVRLLEDPEGLQFGGERRDISVLFSDLRGFTTLTQLYPPETVVRVLNRYFESMVAIISEYNGIIIEFLGDGVMAVFGAPRRLPDHAESAVACALNMQNAMRAINEAHAHEGLPMMEMGIGISSGEVVIGNIGSEKRAKYGIVGTPANLAARIESLSTGQQVLISAETVQRCTAALRIDNTFDISVKGVPHPLRISDVSAIGGTYNVSFSPLLAEMSPVYAGVQVDLAVLDGKSLSDARISATLLACSIHRARIHPDLPLPRYSDVRICRIRTASEERVTEVYAKVVAQSDGDYVLRFTSMFSTDAENFLNGLLQRSTTAS